MQTDRVSWNMKPGRSNLSEKQKKKIECACRVSEFGRRRKRSTKKVGGQDEAPKNLARGMWKNVKYKPEKERNRKVFSQEEECGTNTAYILCHPADAHHILYTEWITAGGLCVCVQIIRQILENQEIV